MKEENKKSLFFCVAQLRHAYQNLITPGAVKEENHKRFANGLIAPQIRTLEKILKEEET